MDSTTLQQVANDAFYNSDTPILTDAEFGLLAEKGLEIKNFRNKVTHNIPVGSLGKIYTLEELTRWLAKQRLSLLVVMPKYDGNAQALSYRNWSLTRAVSRGDGVVGNEFTENVLHTNTPQTLPAGLPADLEARGETLIPKRYQNQFEKNLRNIIAGRLNAKEPQPDILNLADTIIFDLYAPGLETWSQKKRALAQLPAPFAPLFVEVVPSDPTTTYEALKDIYSQWDGGDFPYKIDGLVIEAISDPDSPLPAPSLEPEHKISVKFRGEHTPATIGKIRWTLGKHAKLTPTPFFDPPVEIDGTMVSRASASNYSILVAAELGIGARVGVHKAGDIIPSIVHIYEGSQIGLKLPLCPACDTQSVLNASGVDAICPNPDCEGADLVRIQKTVEMFGIDFISKQTLATLFEAGVDTLEKLFALTVADLIKIPGFAEKSATHLVTSLKAAELVEAQVIKAAFLKGIGARKGGMILNHYGNFDNFIAAVIERGMDNIENFGPIQTRLVEENIGEIIATRDRLLALGVKIIPHQPPVKTTGAKHVCATGTCPGYTRDQLAALLAKHDFIMEDKVSKNSQLLICADPNGTSSKLMAARKKGIQILSYGDFIVKVLGPF